MNGRSYAGRRDEALSDRCYVCGLCRMTHLILDKGCWAEPPVLGPVTEAEHHEQLWIHLMGEVQS